MTEENYNKATKIKDRKEKIMFVLHNINSFENINKTYVLCDSEKNKKLIVDSNDTSLIESVLELCRKYYDNQYIELNEEFDKL